MLAGLTHRLLFSAAAGIGRLRRPFSAHLISSFATMSSSNGAEDVTPSIQTVSVNPSHFPPPYNSSVGLPHYPYTTPPADPSDLHQVFLYLRSPLGILSFYHKMSKSLFANGHAYEAAVINSRMVNTGRMPDDIVPTAVIDAFFRAGKTAEALDAFLKMVSAGIKPNPYTYTLLIKGLAKGGMVEEAAKYMLEMVEDWLNPNVATIVAVFEAFVREGKLDEGRKLLADMKVIGFVPDKEAVMKKLAKAGPFSESVSELLFPKK